MTNGIRMVAGGSVLAMVLASCGSLSGTDDGSASLYVSDVRTEYKDASNSYVACDNVTDGTSISSQTAVATYLTLAGSISSVNVNLRGNTNSTYDGNYSKTFSPGDLTNSGASSYKATFYANPPTDGFLPQSVQGQGIVVNPSTTVSVKRVTTDGYLGSFRSVVTVNTTTGRTGSATATRNISVYSGCNVTGLTGETL